MTSPHPRQAGAPSLPDLVCLSHLRWDFVYQRPHHLLSRFARERRVFFVEEPVWDAAARHLEVSHRGDGLYVVVPHLVGGVWGDDADRAVEALLEGLFREHGVREHVLWYYTPMAVGFTRGLRPLAVIYDCMDELSAFHLAPPALAEREAELLERADLVFTGGRSLYEARRGRHPSVHLFQSSIDAPHFARARKALPDAPEHAGVPHPRLGFFGVIDERMDLELLAGVADARPDWQLVLVGPLAKLDAADLPRRPNLHFPGGAEYARLPELIAGWDVALIPFALNQATRFISPTKTPEYLAAGKPVVSTPIRDVVRPYGDLGLVRIAGTVPEFVAAVEAALAEAPEERRAWMERVDAFLAGTSWERTWEGMKELLDGVVAEAEQETVLAAD